MKRLLVFLQTVSFLSVHAADSIPVLFTQDGTPPTNAHVVWQTEPGVRYTLESSSNILSGWSTVPGYPATASGLSQDHTLNLGKQGFLRIGALDEQPPRVVDQYPAADSFAVPRSADILVQFEDPSGIDPASIRLTVGAIGPLDSGSPGLVFADNTIRYDTDPTLLGDWGQTVTAVVQVADSLGYAVTNTWSFRLVTEPETTTNLFVFGSPGAQRVGQQVSGPAAVLSTRYVEPHAPRALAATETTWNIDAVESNRIVLAYSGGPPPEFTPGQLVCNLVPTQEDEIFYRRVISTSDDSTNALLTIVTAEAGLTNFVSQGAISVSEGSTILNVDRRGAVANAISIGASLTFPRIGMDLSGTEFALREDGFEVTVKGVTYEQGSDPNWLEVSVPEYSWWLTPRIQAALEIDGEGMKSFQAIAQGDVSIAEVVDGQVVLIGISAEQTLFDLTGPTTVVYMGQIGLVPVFATLGLKVGLKAQGQAQAQIEFGATYRQDHSASFGLVYERSTGLECVNRFQSTAPDLRGEAALTGELSFHLALDPRVEFLIYAAAGIKVTIEPSAGIVTTVPLIGGAFDGRIEADLDFVLGTAGPAFDLLDYKETLGPERELRRNIWHGEWSLTPQALAFATHPQSTTVEPGDAVSFTCTIDAPSPPIFQWFHRSLPIPGQTSRSLFLPYVTPGHAGAYFVRATADDLTADSDVATLTVQATTPDNRDSDGDRIPDIHETDTRKWVSTTDRGTNPHRFDTDGDGLGDGVETHTGVYVSRNDTGTDPNRADTDGDGVNDRREIDLGTNPNAGPVPSGMVFAAPGTAAGGTPTVSVGFWIDKFEVTNQKMAEVLQWAYDQSPPLITASGSTVQNGQGAPQELVDLDAPISLISFSGGTFSVEAGKENYPCIEMTWYGAAAYCNYLSQKEERGSAYNLNDWTLDGMASGYRLPSDAQWEYAARGGRDGTDTDYSGSDTIGNVAWYNGNSGGHSHEVDTKSENELNTFNMSGNVWEWCQDWYPGRVGAERVLRGGSWGSNPYECAVSFQLPRSPAISADNVGFRAVLPPGQTMNVPPEITTVPVTGAVEGVPYMYDVDAIDGDNDTLSYSLAAAPTGMVIDAGTGLIEWAPTGEQTGSNSVEVQVADGRGGKDAQTFTVMVTAGAPVGMGCYRGRPL